MKPYPDDIYKIIIQYVMINHTTALFNKSVTLNQLAMKRIQFENQPFYCFVKLSLDNIKSIK